MHRYYVISNQLAGLDHVGKMADIGPLVPPYGQTRYGMTRRAADALAQANAEFQSQFDYELGICYLVVRVAQNWTSGRVVTQFNASDFMEDG